MRTTQQCLFPLILGLLFIAGCDADNGKSAPGSDLDSTDLDSADLGSADNVLRADSEQLSVRLKGRVHEDMICPGNRPPCLRFAGGNVSPNSDGIAWLAGRIINGRLQVDEQLELPSNRFDRDYATNRCADQTIIGRPTSEWFEANEGNPPVPGFVDSWSSDDGIFHIAVGGDGMEAEAVLAEQGVAEQVCLIPGFPATFDELAKRRGQIRQAIAEWTDPDVGSDLHISIDNWTGTISVYHVNIDPQRRAVIESFATPDDPVGNAVTVNILASVEVIDGTLEDYDRMMTSRADSPIPTDHMVASCRAVRFTSIPPDVNEFSPLDDDALAALNEMVNGPTGVEAEGFDTKFAWSIAFRDDEQLVLFGQQAESGNYSYAKFERRDNGWIPAGWGGCHIIVEAPGFGVAEVYLDPKRPIDSDTTELPLLIVERSCASGQAPVGREVVPVVVESDIVIEVIVFVEPVFGVAECPGNPPHPITVSLQEPVGARELLDAHVQPPKLITPATEFDY